MRMKILLQTNFFFIFTLALPFFLQSCASIKSPNIEKSTYINKNTPGFYEEKAKYYYNYKAYSKTIKEYRKIIEKFSHKKDLYKKNLAWAHYEIGFCYLVQKRYELANQFFNKVIKDYTDILPATTLSTQRLNEIKKKLIKN